MCDFVDQHEKPIRTGMWVAVGFSFAAGQRVALHFGYVLDRHRGTIILPRPDDPSRIGVINGRALDRGTIIVVARQTVPQSVRDAINGYLAGIGVPTR